MIDETIVINERQQQYMYKHMKNEEYGIKHMFMSCFAVYTMNNIASGKQAIEDINFERKHTREENMVVLAKCLHYIHSYSQREIE